MAAAALRLPGDRASMAAAGAPGLGLAPGWLVWWLGQLADAGRKAFKVSGRIHSNAN